MYPPPPISTLFPYTTLFRSRVLHTESRVILGGGRVGGDGHGGAAGDRRRAALPIRSEERRVGKECRSRRWAWRVKQKVAEDEERRHLESKTWSKNDRARHGR